MHSLYDDNAKLEVFFKSSITTFDLLNAVSVHIQLYFESMEDTDGVWSGSACGSLESVDILASCLVLTE